MTMLRIVQTLTAVALVAQSAVSSAEPLKPTGKWQVDYTATSCTAKRPFGDYAIAIVPSPLGTATRVIIEGPGRALRARQFPSFVDPADGRGAVRASSLVYPLATKGRRGLYTVIPNDIVARALASGRIEVRAGQQDSRILWDNRSVTAMGAALSIPGGAALSKALDTCMADLRKVWGMVDGQLPTPALEPQPQGNVMSIFTSDDYPEDAMAANQGGTTAYVLMLDENGAVIDCAIKQSSGVATLDAMGCQVIRERARFKPARDPSGKPVKSIYITPAIRWVLE